ncbi:universal stress protein [Altericista sp. CCNU0014]|uniref:universal stress protein n=1 Tax=Altericista sp. CCNU0014 TaxID=3082949 RepID=UPI00384CA956
MYRHILVALDHTELSDIVLEHAIALAKGFSAKLTLLHVLCSEEGVSPVMPLMPLPDYYPALASTTLEQYQQEWEAFSARSLAHLAQYQTQAEAAGVRAEHIQKGGRPGPTICEVAKELGADLIVLGRRGHSGLSELLIGSVSNYVVHHCAGAVLVCNLSGAITAEARQTASDEKAAVS